MLHLAIFLIFTIKNQALTTKFEPTPKIKNNNNATKTPRHKDSQSKENQETKLGVTWCLGAFVARKLLFGVDSNFDHI